MDLVALKGLAFIISCARPHFRTAGPPGSMPWKFLAKLPLWAGNLNHDHCHNISRYGLSASESIIIEPY